MEPEKNVNNEKSSVAEPDVPLAKSSDSAPAKATEAESSNSAEAKNSSAWFPSGLLASSWISRDEKDAKGTSSSSGAPWGASWIQSAKEKTLGTLESMKKDLNEFSDTVQQEAATMASVAANSVKSQAQFLHQQISQQLSTDSAATITPADEADEAVGDEDEGKKTNDEGKEKKKDEAKKEAADEPNFFTPGKWMRSIVETVQKLGVEDTIGDEADFTEELRHDAVAALPRKTVLDQFQLLQIQNDERTFLQAPSQNVDLYREWLADFKIVEYNGEINILLGYNPKLREIYSRLVPAKVDNHTFWNRYFFKVHVQELDKEIAEARAKSKDSGNTMDGNNGSGCVGERDETWSMCSSANNDIQDLDDETASFDTPTSNNGGEAYEKDGKEARRQRDELKTPQLDEEEPLTDLDDEGDWEECAPSTNNNSAGNTTKIVNDNNGKK